MYVTIYGKIQNEFVQTSADLRKISHLNTSIHQQTTMTTISRKQWSEITQVLTKLIPDEDKYDEVIGHLQRILRYSEENVRKKSAQVIASIRRKKHLLPAESDASVLPPI